MKTWLVKSQLRVSKAAKSFADKKEAKAMLVYGIVKDGKIRGTIHHVLYGPLATSIMDKFASDLNARGYVPPAKTGKTRADGFTNKLGDEVLL